MPFHHLYNLIKRSQIKIKAVGTPCRNLLHIIRAGNQAFPRLTIIFRTLPRNKPVLLRIMIPEKNSSFIQSYPNIGFGSICFYIKSGSGHSHFHPLQIHLKGTVFISGNIKIPFSPKLHRTIEQSKLLGIPQTGILVQVYNTAILQNYPHLFTIRNTYFSIFRFRENPRPVHQKQQRNA